MVKPARVWQLGTSETPLTQEGWVLPFNTFCQGCMMSLPGLWTTKKLSFRTNLWLFTKCWIWQQCCNCEQRHTKTLQSKAELTQIDILVHKPDRMVRQWWSSWEHTAKPMRRLLRFSILDGLRGKYVLLFNYSCLLMWNLKILNHDRIQWLFKW